MVREKHQVAVIVPCGGLGTRLGGQVAKQFLKVEDQPILGYTLACLESHPRIDRVVLVVPQGWEQKVIQEILSPFGYQKVTDIKTGGQTRQESVAVGLQALSGWPGPVLIHDGVRPLVQGDLIDRVIDSVLEHGSGVAAVPVTDTIKQANDQGWIETTLPRQGLWQAQTPQGFWWEDLQKAHQHAKKNNLEGTDDAFLVEALGQQVRLVQGDVGNIKVTYPEDLERMVLCLKERKAKERLA